MDLDDDVCVCMHVSLRKLQNFALRERPVCPERMTECLGAGTGCQWCVPFLKALHDQHHRGQEPDLRVSPERYVQARSGFHKSGQRDSDVLHDAEAAGLHP